MGHCLWVAQQVAYHPQPLSEQWALKKGFSLRYDMSNCTYGLFSLGRAILSHQKEA